MTIMYERQTKINGILFLIETLLLSHRKSKIFEQKTRTNCPYCGKISDKLHFKKKKIISLLITIIKKENRSKMENKFRLYKTEQKSVFFF